MLLKIKDIGTVITGKTPSTENEEFWNGDICFITIDDINVNPFISDTKRKITGKGLKSLGHNILSGNSVLVNCVGNVGVVGITRLTCATNQQINSITNISDICNPLFLYYKLLTMKEQLEKSAGQTILKILPKTVFENIEIDLPDRKTQDKIVDILSGIDNQIERNNDMVKKLQVLAHTTYQRWFEQFEFPNENGKPYKSSGGKMIWNDELKREIPDTWNSSTLGASIIECPKSSLPVNAASITPDGYPFFTSGDNVFTHNEWIVDGAHCFLNTGGNADVKFWLGKAAYSTDTWCIHFGRFTFLYYEYLQGLKPQMDRLFFAGSGLKHLQKEILKQRTVILPPDDVIDQYNNITSNYYEQTSVLLAENKTLCKFKDTLLPLLMNGQLCV